MAAARACWSSRVSNWSRAPHKMRAGAVIVAVSVGACGDQSGERFPPHVSRHADTVSDPAVDVPPGHRMEPGKPGQELPHPGGIHGIGQLIDLVGEGRPALQAARRPDQDEAGHPVWAGNRHLLGDVPAAGGPQQYGGGDAGRIHERRDICSDLRQRVSRRGLISVAVTAQIHRHGMDSARQQRQQPIKGTPRLTPGVQQHDRRRGGRAGQDIGNAHPGCQLNPANAQPLAHLSTLTPADIQPHNPAKPWAACHRLPEPVSQAGNVERTRRSPCPA